MISKRDKRDKRDWLAPQRPPLSTDHLDPLTSWHEGEYWLPAVRRARLDAEVDRRGLRPGSSWLDVLNDSAERSRLRKCAELGLAEDSPWSAINDVLYPHTRCCVEAFREGRRCHHGSISAA